MRPARVQALLLAAAFLSAVRGAPPGSSPPSELLQVGLPDQAEGRAVIAQFRSAGPARPYYLEFDLERIPRRGPTQTHPGRLWGDRYEKGAVLRVEVDPGTPGERRFILQNGPEAAVWVCGRQGEGFGPARRVGELDPLLPNLPVTPFDLQMPFLYWPDERLVSVMRVRGRPAHVFVFHPPPGAGLPADVGAVRAYLDTEYRAPVQTELVDRKGEVMKTFSLLDLKKVGEEWLPKAIDVRDEASRDKGRLSLTAAALDLQPDPAWFDPGQLGAPAQIPPPGQLVRF